MTLAASWNLKHQGWESGKDMLSVAQVASDFDLIALREDVSAEGLVELEAAFEAITNRM